MKKIIFAIIAIIAIAGVVAFNVSLSTKKVDVLSMLALANVEALAQEEGGFTITCNQYCVGNAQCWQYDWGYNNMNPTCYFTGYMYHHCAAC